MAIFFLKEDVLRKLKEIKPLIEEFEKISNELRDVNNRREALRRKIEDIFPNYECYDENGEWKKGAGSYQKEKHRLRDEAEEREAEEKHVDSWNDFLKIPKPIMPDPEIITDLRPSKEEPASGAD